MPNKPKTPLRSFRMEEDTWADLLTAAAAAGMDRSELLRDLSRWWLRRPGAKMPPRPQRLPQ